MAKKKTGNINNLQPVKSKEEARERGRNGGIKSQQVQRERRKAKECMNMILSLDAKGEKSRKMMAQMGIADEEQQNIMLLMTTMFAKAVSTGDPSAVKAILEIAGDMQGDKAQDTKPVININVAAATKADAEEV